MQTYDKTDHAAVTLSSSTLSTFPNANTQTSSPVRTLPAKTSYAHPGEEDRSALSGTYSSERPHRLSYTCAEMTPARRGDEEVRRRPGLSDDDVASGCYGFLRFEEMMAP